MAVLTSAQCQAMVDNIGQTIIDALTSQPSSSELNTVSTDLTTEITRIQAITDLTVQSAMLSAYAIEQRSVAVTGSGAFEPAGNLYAFLVGLTYANLLSKSQMYVCDALDFVCAQVTGNTGLANYLLNNSIYVDVYSADVFNTFAKSAGSGAFSRKFGASAPSAIPSTQVFPHTNVDYINQWTSTGATTGTLAAGTASLATLTGGITIPGGGILEAYAGSAIGASGYTITATYTNIAGSTGQTMTFTVPASAAINTVFTPSGSNYVASIQSIAVTTGSSTTNDKINFRLKPGRAITA